MSDVALSGMTADGTFEPPHPGSKQMPRWTAGELPEPPRFTAKSWAMMIGPGLVMGAAAIGGGEWLAGPLATARYGGAILWLATLSILGQVIYNIEISRYTIYSGEPIFTGKFRLMPGPGFWLVLYLLLDFGSFLPYAASNAATPLAALFVGRIPDVTSKEMAVNFLGMSFTDVGFIQILTYVVFLLSMLPMVMGGKVYNSMKVLMSFKFVVVVGFLLVLALFYSKPATWMEIGSGFFKFGTVPVHGPVDARPDAIDPGAVVDDVHLDNIFISLWEGRGFPALDLTMIGVLTALASISGQGGLTNTTISAYTRDQGWGMGQHVGAIPSIIGGKKLKLSHSGMVFAITAASVARFKRWYRFILRDQLVVWMPACFVGLALPAMLSMQFLPRGLKLEGPNKDWLAAGMTADGVAQAVGLSWGPLFWNLTLFCGFLTLTTSACSTSEGFIRRWVDVLWTGLPWLRKWEDHHIRFVYFAVVCIFTLIGVAALSYGKPTGLLIFATTIYNYALGFSCFHTLFVNLRLLPQQLRPGLLNCSLLSLSGLFFLTLAIITTAKTVVDAVK